MKTLQNLAVSLLLGVFTPSAHAELPVKQVLTLNVAKRIAAAAEAEATRRGSTVVIVVVDDGGHIIVLERLDDTRERRGGHWEGTHRGHLPAPKQGFRGPDSRRARGRPGFARRHAVTRRNSHHSKRKGDWSYWRQWKHAPGRRRHRKSRRGRLRWGNRRAIEVTQ